MKTKFKFSLFSTLVVALLSCSTSDIEQGLQDLQLKLVVLDGTGIEKNIFDIEADITLALKAVNGSDDKIELGTYSYFCYLPNHNKEFFLVYKVTNNNEQIPIGRPFEEPINCYAINLPILIQPHSEQFLRTAKWLDNPNNSRLERGEYYSSLSIELGGKVFNTEVSFKIQ